MNPEDRAFYESQLDMFITPGWKNFISNVNDLIDSNRKTVFNIKEANEFYESKGVMKTLLWLSSYEDIIKGAMQEVENASV